MNHRIIGPPSAPRDTVEYNLRQLGDAPLFITNIFPAVWAAFAVLGLDPVGGVAQARHETGRGFFGGRVTALWCNTCGLKNRRDVAPPLTSLDEPLAHAQFPNWQLGALAQAQHVCAYAGLDESYLSGQLGPGWQIIDPRWDFVVRKGHAAQAWEDMNGLWAKPGLTYGTSIAAAMDLLTRPIPPDGR